MTIFYIVESTFEFLFMIIAISFLLVARQPGEGLVITKRFIKRKKYIGFAIVFIVLTMFSNYGYIIFRYLYPPSPYDFIEPLRFPQNNCVTVIK